MPRKKAVEIESVKKVEEEKKTKTTKPVKEEKTGSSINKFIVAYATETKKLYYRIFENKSEAFKFYYHAKKSTKLLSVRLISI